MNKRTEIFINVRNRLKNRKVFKYLLLLMLTLLTNNTIFGQNLDSLEVKTLTLENKIDSLENAISESEILLDSLEKEYQISLAKKDAIEQNQIRENGIPTTMGYLSTDLREAPFGEKLFEIESGEQIKVIGVKDNFYEIIYNGIKGYVGRHYVVETDEIKDFVKTENPRLKSLIKRFGESDGRRIYAGKVWIGMTTTEARASLGRPDDINTSRGSWGTHSQWVYYDKYLYFENGVLSSWQN